jgi:hypothetical protein
VTLNSDPIPLGTGQLDAEGVFTTNLTIAAPTSTGAHTIQATAGNVSLAALFTVRNALPPTTASRQQRHTVRLSPHRRRQRPELPLGPRSGCLQQAQRWRAASMSTRC